MGSKKPTLKDVARHAGVSTATVERALNNSGRIREDTKARVLQTIKALGYSTNDVGRALQNNRTYTILAVYHTVPEYFTADFARGFAAAQANLTNRGLLLKTLRTESLIPSHAVEALRQTDLSSVDAVVIDCGGTELDDTIRDIITMGIPVATFGSDSPSSNRNFYVGENPFISGQLAGEVAAKMIGAKGSLIVFQGPTSVYALNKRTQGFLNVIENEYPEIQILSPIDHNDDDTSAIRGAVKILNSNNRPSGIFCNSAGGTIALHRSIKYLDLCAEDIPVIIGYDFNREIHEMLQLGYCCATIYQNPYLQAYNVLNYMFEYITKNVIPPNARNYVPSNLVFKHNSDMFLQGVETDAP